MKFNWWLESWFGERPPRRAAVELAEFAHEAAAGESLPRLLERVARSLLDAAQADRVGIWLGGEELHRLSGLVLHNSPDPVPAEWNSLEVSAPFWKKLLASAIPVLWDLHVRPTTSTAFDPAFIAQGPLAEMERAVWWPVRSAGRPIGLALLAFRSLRLRQPEKTAWVTRAFLDQLAVAVRGLCPQPSPEKQQTGQAELWSPQCSPLEETRPRQVVRLAKVETNRAAPVPGEARGQSEAIYARLMQTEKMAALGQLVSGIAHELNNPLTSIMGYAQLLLARIPGRRDIVSGRYLSAVVLRDALRDAERIYQEAERAGHIVKNLLLFSREMPPERHAVDLNEIVERTLALRSYELKVENIRVELRPDSRLPPTLADPHQLQQVVLNLLVNAEQAILGVRSLATGGRVGESADQGRIELRTYTLPGRPPESEPPRIALAISDNGPGVSPEIAPRMFDPFFTTKPMGIGTGLGLSIVYGIVREHGGDVYLQDSPSNTAEDGEPKLAATGATFVVELPVLSALEAQAAPKPLEGAKGKHWLRPESASVSGSASSASGRKRIHVLVIEDESTVAQLIADVLAEDGHRVDVVLDSLDGLSRVRQFAYDLIICDLRMPRLDGRAFYRALARSGHPAQHRILFVTGDTLSPHTLDFLKQTALPFLAKPFLVEELKSVVYRFLEILPAKRGPEPAAAEPSHSRGNRPPVEFAPVESVADPDVAPGSEGMRRT